VKAAAVTIAGGLKRGAADSRVCKEVNMNRKFAFVVVCFRVLKNYSFRLSSTEILAV
jgi:hypothetical protein